MEVLFWPVSQTGCAQLCANEAPERNRDPLRYRVDRTNFGERRKRASGVNFVFGCARPLLIPHKQSPIQHSNLPEPICKGNITIINYCVNGFIVYYVA